MSYIRKCKQYYTYKITTCQYFFKIKYKKIKINVFYKYKKFSKNFKKGIDKCLSAYYN